MAEFFLLAGQRLDRDFEIARHQHLHAVAVETDELAQERNRQQVLAFFVLLLEDDLGEHRAGDVLAGLGVIDDEILAGLDHGGEVFERHVGARAGIVESPVGVLFNGDGLCGLVCLPPMAHDAADRQHHAPIGERLWTADFVGLIDHFPFAQHPDQIKESVG